MSRTRKTILFVHGRGRKPDADKLMGLWQRALLAGLDREHADLHQHISEVDFDMFYYADAIAHLDKAEYDSALDIKNRRHTLERLISLTKSKDFRRRHYEELPGKSAVKEFVMDMSAMAGLSGPAISRALPELKYYWSDDTWRTLVQQQLEAKIVEVQRSASKLLIVSHCMGSVIAYDALWNLSTQKAVGGQAGERIDTWITLGSPLASNYVRQRLQGAKSKGVDRYPNNINEWHNISAEDDFVCHDKTVADDYSEMLKHRRIGNITDNTIYNLSVRYGRSNPHSSAGYLIHPRVTEYLAVWLNTE